MLSYVSIGQDLPAPVLQVRVSMPLEDDFTAECRGILASAASVTCLPAEVLHQLGDGLVYRTRPVFYATGSSLLRLYTVDLEVAGRVFRDHEVIEYDKPDALIGRDILNHFKIVLDGIRGEWSIEEP